VTASAFRRFLVLRTHILDCKLANLLIAGSLTSILGLFRHHHQPEKSSTVTVKMADNDEEPIWPPPGLNDEMDVEHTAPSITFTQAPLRRENPQLSGSRKDSRSGGHSSRGRNWSEGDSILLVHAYAWSEENRKGIIVNFLEF